MTKYIRSILIALPLLSVCCTITRINPIPVVRLELDLTEIRLNKAAIDYGAVSQHDGWVNCNVFRFNLDPFHCNGHVLLIENLTEFPLEFDWTKSCIINDVGETFNLLNPNYALARAHHTQICSPRVMIAPYAKKSVPMIAVGALRSFEMASAIASPLCNLDSGLVGQAERIMLFFDFRGSVLTYDLGIKVLEVSPIQPEAIGNK